MLIEILRHTPVWVWGLLAALVALGLSQRRDRVVPAWRLLAAPVGLALWGASAMPAATAAHPWLLGVWAAVLIGVAETARRTVPLGRASRLADGRFALPGSGWPLLLILSIFLVKYVLAVAQVLDPAWRTELALLAPVTLASGALSGLFLGRTLALVSRLKRPASPTSPAAA